MRRFFRFHLLTAIVLIFLAGALIKLNAGVETSLITGYTQEGTEFNPIFTTYQHTGWPYRVHILQIYFDISQRPPAIDTMPREIPALQVSYLLIDIAIAVNALFGAAVLCEWLLRRRRLA